MDMNEENQINKNESNSDSEQESLQLFESLKLSQSYEDSLVRENSESVSTSFYESVLRKIQTSQSESVEESLLRTEESNLQEKFLLGATSKDSKQYFSEIFSDWDSESISVSESQEYVKHLSKIQSDAEELVQRANYISAEINRMSFLSLQESEINSESMSDQESIYKKRINLKSEGELSN